MSHRRQACEQAKLVPFAGVRLGCDRASRFGRFGIIVVGIQRRNRQMDFKAEPETIILPGDTLVVLGPPPSLERLEAEAS